MNAQLAIRATLGTLALALGGCAWDAPMSTVVARSDFARAILHVYSIVTWVTGIIGAPVFLWLLLGP